jgi:hypothetical protein
MPAFVSFLIRCGSVVLHEAAGNAPQLDIAAVGHLQFVDEFLIFNEFFIWIL